MPHPASKGGCGSFVPPRLGHPCCAEHTMGGPTFEGFGHNMAAAPCRPCSLRLGTKGIRIRPALDVVDGME